MAATESDEHYIRRCIELARRAAEDGDEPFSALLVIDDEVALSATNRVIRDGDRTQHAELLLVQDALRRFDAETLQRATLYASTEPCIMCAAAIYWGRIPRVVFGCSQEAFARETGCRFGMPCVDVFATGQRKVEVVGPVLEEEALAVHRRTAGHGG